MGDLAAAVTLAITLAVTGLGMGWVGRAGARRRIDWNWSGHTAATTPKDRWDAAHRAAGPIMVSAGAVMAAAGVVGGALVAWRTSIGVAVTMALVIVSLALTMWSIGRGLRILEPSPAPGRSPDP